MAPSDGHVRGPPRRHRPVGGADLPAELVDVRDRFAGVEGCAEVRDVGDPTGGGGLPGRHGPADPHGLDAAPAVGIPAPIRFSVLAAALVAVGGTGGEARVQDLALDGHPRNRPQAGLPFGGTVVVVVGLDVGLVGIVGTRVGGGEGNRVPPRLHDQLVLVGIESPVRIPVDLGARARTEVVVTAGVVVVRGPLAAAPPRQDRDQEQGPQRSGDQEADPAGRRAPSSSAGSVHRHPSTLALFLSPHRPLPPVGPPSAASDMPRMVHRTESGPLDWRAWRFSNARVGWGDERLRSASRCEPHPP